MILRRENERLAGGVERKLVSLADLEIDRDLAIEVVKALDLSETPRNIQHTHAGREGHQLAQTGERIGKRTHPESDSLDE